MRQNRLIINMIKRSKSIINTLKDGYGRIKMAAISELIRIENNGKLSFGDYTLASKAKLDNFEKDGDIYKVKTFKEITKLEKNGLFVYESIPAKERNEK